jgi:hypothetical protein
VSRPVFSFRPKLEDPSHKRAWDILQRVPEGQKNAFLVQVILQAEDAGHLESCIRQIIREELKDMKLAVPDTVEAEEKTNGIPMEMLDFLSSMEDE